MNDDRLSERLDQIVGAVAELRGELRALRTEFDASRRGNINLQAVYLAIAVAAALVGIMWVGAFVR